MTFTEGNRPVDQLASLPVHIRWMIRKDMGDVEAIERESFEYPWSEDDFVKTLRERNCIGFVCEDKNGRVVGFFIYELHKTRLHILNMAVASDCRRQGVGRQILNKCIGKLSNNRRKRLTMEVRESNLPMHLFLRSQGFKAVMILRDFYEDVKEDAYLFMYHINSGRGD